MERNAVGPPSGYLPAQPSFPHVFSGNPGGIGLDRRLKHSEVVVLRLISEESIFASERLFSIDLAPNDPKGPADLIV
jgi:hypothetical protein